MNQAIYETRLKESLIKVDATARRILMPRRALFGVKRGFSSFAPLLGEWRTSKHREGWANMVAQFDRAADWELGASGTCGFLHQSSCKNPDLWAPLGSLQGKKRAFACFLGLDGAKRHRLLGGKSQRGEVSRGLLLSWDLTGDSLAQSPQAENDGSVLTAFFELRFPVRREPKDGMGVFLGLLVTLGLILTVRFFYSQMGANNRTSWIQFYAKGKDLGFSFAEIELLRKLAVTCGLTDPMSLFGSLYQLDACIRTFVRNMSISGEDQNEETQDFLSKLYDYRKKLEMERPRIKTGITTTRQINEGQQLRLLVSGSGVFKSQLIKNTTKYLTITRPASAKLANSFKWTGLRLSVYFWREDDAGYVFDSDVLEEVYSRSIAALKISPSEVLFRTQKRQSIRVKIHKGALLYLVGNDEEKESGEGGGDSAPGLKCYLEDLSETGCAVTVGGRASAGLRIKLLFNLNNSPTAFQGTVRSVEFKEEANRSLLHVEADPLPVEVRNKILGLVFGTMSEEDDLPFRISEEEPRQEAVKTFGESESESGSEIGDMEPEGEEKNEALG
jgi:c-di-GMP-binding flagellar brake protein YcgR